MFIGLIGLNKMTCVFFSHNLDMMIL